MSLKFWYSLYFVYKITLSIASEQQALLTVDQRQSGRVNIHLNIKDVAIIEFGQLLDEVNNDSEDYYYDEEDLTVKPWFTNSTAKPTSSTQSLSANSTTTATIYVTPTESSIDEESTIPTVPASLSIDNSVNSSISTVYAADVPTPQPAFIDRIPVQIIQEPILTPKIRAKSALKFPSYRNKESKIYRVKNSRGQNGRCQVGTFRDEHGNCKIDYNLPVLKSIFLRRIFSILKDLPLND